MWSQNTWLLTPSLIELSGLALIVIISFEGLKISTTQQWHYTQFHHVVKLLWSSALFWLYMYESHQENDDYAIINTIIEQVYLHTMVWSQCSSVFALYHTVYNFVLINRAVQGLHCTVCTVGSLVANSLSETCVHQPSMGEISIPGLSGMEKICCRRYEWTGFAVGSVTTLHEPLYRVCGGGAHPSFLNVYPSILNRVSDDGPY